MRTSQLQRKRGTHVVLNERDHSLLQLVALLGIVSRDHIRRLCGWTCVSDLNRRLRKLFDSEFLDRRLLPRVTGSAPAHYCLGVAGVRILVQTMQLDEAKLNVRRYRYRHLSDHYLPHELAITDVVCQLKFDLDQRVSCTLAEWYSDCDLTELCNASDLPGEIELKPDGLAVYEICERRYHAFIEVDLGTESLPRVVGKIGFYRNYIASGQFDQHFGPAADVHLLLITDSETRARNLAAKFDRIADLKIFIGILSLINRGFLSSPIWLRPGVGKFTGLHSESELGEEATP